MTTDDAAIHVGEVDGLAEPFAWPADSTLLDALLQAGIPARHSCTDGQCGTCQCTLTGGPFHMLHNEVLGSYEIEQEDQTLACQTLRDGEGPYRAEFE